MRYSGAICDGCGEQFKEDDDIVVCPECATPQHRECYEKNHACVNEEKHSEDFQWHGAITTQAKTELKDKLDDKNKPLTCPTCGYENKPGSDYCVQCGQKFTFMGINLIEKQQELEKQEKMLSEENKKSASYPPPFEVGKGEGFERFNNASKKQDDIKNQSEIQNNSDQSDHFHNEQQKPEEQFLNMDFQYYDQMGNCPPDMKIGGNDAKRVAMAIGAKGGKYSKTFYDLEHGKKVKWNWASFFFSPFWFFYRKMYKSGIIIMTVDICLGLLGVAPAVNLADYVNSIMTTDFSSISDGAYMEIANNIASLYRPLLLVFAGMVLLRFVSGFIANSLYKKYIGKVVGKTAEMTDADSCFEIFYRQGGTSLLFGTLSFFLEYLLINLVGSFMI